MKFLVPNYSCLQNLWLGGSRPQIPVLSVLCPELNLLNHPPNKIPGYATAWKVHKWVLLLTYLLCGRYIANIVTWWGSHHLYLLYSVSDNKLMRNYTRSCDKRLYGDYLRAGCVGVRLPAEARDFLFLKGFRESVGSTRLPIEWVPGALFRR
jgi:hypothetical protein